MGRVVGQEGNGLVVQVVGVGPVRFARDELLPRKQGQLRFAARRAAAWDALRPCIVLEATVGSRAWGLADEGSDTDLRGVMVLPLSWTAGLAPPTTELTSLDGSATYWEVEKAMRQGLRADPNTLELLFVPGVRATDELGQWVLDARDAFVSREIFGSFGRYALSQLHKLTQAHRLAEHRRMALDWAREAVPPSLDEAARRLAEATSVDVPRAKEYLKQLYRSLFDQGQLAACDFTAFVDYAKGASLDLDMPRELRPKNAYNLLRLIATATDWLRTGHPELVVREPLATRLRAIKRGEVPLHEVLSEAEAMTPALEAARLATPLPPRADVGRVDALLRRIRIEVARRFIAADPGPFGRDAPSAPEADWEEGDAG